MWVTSPMIPKCLEIFKHNKFTYRTVVFVWVKLDENGNPQRGKGNYTQPCCEFLLLATKGDPSKYAKTEIKES